MRNALSPLRRLLLLVLLVGTTLAVAAQPPDEIGFTVSGRGGEVVYTLGVNTFTGDQLAHFVVGVEAFLEELVQRPTERVVLMQTGETGYISLSVLPEQGIYLLTFRAEPPRAILGLEALRAVAATIGSQVLANAALQEPAQP